jgi:NADPH:quinone reductase-like Zn-dependent oxidoreductase
MTSLGVVPEDEHRLGHEGAGVVTRMGRDANSFHTGDRVVFYARGAFANRIRVPKEAAFSIPGSLSFEQAATMSVVYFTAVYSLMEIARVKKGQSVLIHSAAGGVGLASIQVCQYLGAEIYATAGSPEKRNFLSEQYGIPQERIFSSRDIKFAAGIRFLSRGRGVDFVLNSLTGELLDESWRLLADNGECTNT